MSTASGARGLARYQPAGSLLLAARPVLALTNDAKVVAFVDLPVSSHIPTRPARSSLYEMPKEWVAAENRTATAMIRITIHHTHDEVVLQLEGRLVSAWVDELEASWRAARLTLKGRRLRVDLRGVCQVDDRGRELMGRLYGDGAAFLTSGCVMPEVVREVAAANPRSLIERTTS